MLSGCTSHAVIDNRPKGAGASEGGYAILAEQQGRAANDISPMLAFSGGGPRAAALAYGVLQARRDTEVVAYGLFAVLLNAVGL